ncbi:hypothetical protein BCY90_25455 [Agrobacterium deltaense]|uniref:acyl carrier protein n=1 Tax=Agrobacterium TaxID=357 RepID=UPI000745A239|nr:MULTISPECIES: acyl carrier protein [Agrobacterium]KVK45334.1 hypothetical protein L901_25785 [Agrobacterium sp. D14]RKF36015.1 hypothetical protein BCY90_25455 [Agrobacterium deltaense]UXT42592.1 acyl carrier protein [Agrobacterium tumefaciens]
MCENVENEIIAFMSSELGIQHVTSESKITELDIDSLVFVELCMVLERKFNIEIEAEELVACDTIHDIAQICVTRRLTQVE